MTIPTMKWTVDDAGNWVRRCFDLTITAEGKSDAPLNLANSRKAVQDDRR